MSEVPQLFLAVTEVLLQTRLPQSACLSLHNALLGGEWVFFGCVGVFFLSEEGLDAQGLVVVVAEALYYHDLVFPEPSGVVREVFGG
jgi:hypothetical protein